MVHAASRQTDDCDLTSLGGEERGRRSGTPSQWRQRRSEHSGCHLVGYFDLNHSAGRRSWGHFHRQLAVFDAILG